MTESQNSEVESLRQQLSAEQNRIASSAYVGRLMADHRQQLAAREVAINEIAELVDVVRSDEAWGVIEQVAEVILASRAGDRLADPKREWQAEALEEFAVTLRERYPDDVFVRPSGEDYDRLNKALARSNIDLDRFSADLMRRAAAQADREAAEYRKGAGQ